MGTSSAKAYELGREGDGVKEEDQGQNLQEAKFPLGSFLVQPARFLPTSGVLCGT